MHAVPVQYPFAAPAASNCQGMSTRRSSRAHAPAARDDGRPGPASIDPARASVLGTAPRHV